MVAIEPPSRRPPTARLIEVARPSAERLDRPDRLRHAVGVVVRDPDDARVLAEPAVLASGEPTGAGLGLLDRLGQRPVAGEEADDLSVADRPLGGEPVREAAVEEGLDLLHEARREQLVHPP